MSTGGPDHHGPGANAPHGHAPHAAQEYPDNFQAQIDAAHHDIEGAANHPGVGEIYQAFIYLSTTRPTQFAVRSETHPPERIAAARLQIDELQQRIDQLTQLAQEHRAHLADADWWNTTGASGYRMARQRLMTTLATLSSNRVWQQEKLTPSESCAQAQGKLRQEIGKYINGTTGGFGKVDKPDEAHAGIDNIIEQADSLREGMATALNREGERSQTDFGGAYAQQYYNAVQRSYGALEGILQSHFWREAQQRSGRKASVRELAVKARTSLHGVQFSENREHQHIVHPQTSKVEEILNAFDALQQEMNEQYTLIHHAYEHHAETQTHIHERIGEWTRRAVNRVLVVTGGLAIAAGTIIGGIKMMKGPDKTPPRPTGTASVTQPAPYNPPLPKDDE